MNEGTNTIDLENVWNALRQVHDPELPFLTLLELKIIRDVMVHKDTVTVRITPTFLGCPALEQMKKDIVTKLNEAGIEKVAIEVLYSPVWSTDLLEDDAREKLRQFGIAPPPQKTWMVEALALAIVCPHCGSEKTRLENSFGPTLCRQLYYCDGCQQMFERFKPL